jgi:hypothetical protein
VLDKKLQTTVEMVSFTVLNPLPKKDTGTSKELEIEKFLGIHLNALKFQSLGNLETALQLYLQIAESDLMSEELFVLYFID